ncbi:unnamed protein product [Diabrotica balteata]|uniref:SH2 domain-containing protein n=1 Tax=Diabrotica balteata TaxID=107213 RepID=A0A9N9XEX3_DIABA|nr:unnamed protein product [Diabrotica balteata]
MDLNRIRLLSEDNLLKAIKDSGNDDIANLLKDRGIDGKSFLEFQELQAISWKLPRIQVKNLTTFISQVKQDPSVLVKCLPDPQPFPPRRVFPVPGKSHVVKPPVKLPSVPHVESNNTRFNKPPLELKFPLSSPDVPPIPKPIENQQTAKSESGMSVARIKERPAFPLPRRASIKPIEPPDDPKVDYGYLTPDDIGTKYPSFADQFSPKQRVLPSSNNKLSKATNNHQTNVDSEDDAPALPPIRNLPRIESKKSPVGNRKLPPVPPESPDIKRRSASLEPPTNRRFQQTAPVEPEDENDDNNIYDDVLEEQKHKKQELTPGAVQKPFEPIKKYPSSIAENINNNTLDRDSQNKRGNFLGNLGKLLAEKWTPPKTENTISYNYENHMLKSETTPTSKSTFSFKDRPLPEIPKEYQPAYRKNSFKDTETVSSNPSTFSRNNREKGKGYNQPQTVKHFQQRINPEAEHADNEHEDEEQVYENVNEQNNSNTPDEFDAPEYENNESFSHNQNVRNKTLLVEALQRQSARSNESTRKQIDEKSSHNVPTTPDFVKEEREGGVFYGNIDQPRSFPYSSKRSPFRSNVPSLGEDDADAPEYGNIDESDISTNTSLTQERRLATNRTNFNSPPIQKPLNQTQTQSAVRTSVPSILALKLNEALKAREKKIQEKINKNAPNKNNFAKIAPPNESDSEDTKSERIIGLRKRIPEDSFANQAFYGNVNDSIRQELHEHRPELEEERKSNADLIFNINHEPFYRNTDRKGAKQLLRNFTDGAFLFRPSEKYFLVLTIKYNKKFYNLGIERTVNNKIRLNADMSSISPEFETLKAFVEYFTKEAVTFSDQGTILEIYLNPVLPADIF